MDFIDEYRQKVAGLVAQHGHVVQAVMTNPAYSYTVGLHHTHALPEIVVMGLDPRIAQPVLNDIARQIKAGQLTPIEGTDFMDVFAGAPARFRRLAAHEVAAYLKVAAVVNGTTDFPAWQLIWPDAAGKFAGDSGVSANAVATQDLRFTLDEFSE